jgi:ribonuclease Z
MMNLTILGCHSATPRENKHTTSQLLELKGNLFLIDCGEGTQMQLRKSKIKFARIRHIFISHLHGDHFYGLVGLISTFRLLGRTAPLTVYGPKGIKEIITLQLKLAKSWTDYELHFVELEADQSELIYEDEHCTVRTLPLDHRVYTNGFLFTAKSNQRKINSEAISGLDLQPYHFAQLQEGKDLKLENGTTLSNSALTYPTEPPKQYAFCSDTAYKEDLVQQLEGVDLLYHEATFLDQHKALAAKTKHSTAKQAATIARKAGVKRLLLGHYSNRYSDKNEFIEEAATVFANVFLSEDLKSLSI